MEKIKCFIDLYIPTETCNLRCHYCYITQTRKFNEKLAKFTHSPEEIRKAFSRERWGGACFINLCAGGETLLSQEVLPVVKEILSEGHYVSIVTNGTITKRFEDISMWPKELLKHLFLKFSYHFLEMKRLDWTELFFDNVRKMKEAGVSFTVEATPSDELIPYIDELKSTCMKQVGALCHVTIARDGRTDGIDVLSSYSWEEYIKIWRVFDSALFDFKAQIFYQKRKEFCYAGAWSYWIDLESGRIQQCYRTSAIGNVFDNMDKPVPKIPIGYACALPHCYNGHAFLSFGDIPELPSPTYAEERNRVCDDGTEWLQPEMDSFMRSRLYESNRQYNAWEKEFIRFKQLAVKKGIRNTKLYRLYHWIKE
ncbi:MAG: 4Fe-4S cluster-binding domain-containing protein [Eubacteriales bacterium]|nr:4Fe-4S cluster-binding domain-containing protein [Eubacteriales bacterium]